MGNPYGWIERDLNTLHRAGWYRRTRTLEGRSGPVVDLDGRKLINFASNDYLGLAGDERLIEAAIQAIKTYGTGSTGSRLLSGHRHIHRELEISLADLKKTEDAIVFSSGYLANLGTISCLVSSKDLILSDRLNHSSLKNGAKLSGARIIDYGHNDLEDIEQHLIESRSSYRRCLIITDTVFSMDGDICPLEGILDLADRYECMVLVDEAHATGVMGETGAGCVEYLGLTGRKLIQIGTLSKALGSLGGYCAGDRNIIDFLRNRAPTWVYTTGLSPGDTAAAKTAVDIIGNEPERRARLHRNTAFVKENLRDFNLLPSESPILCIGLKSPEEALEWSEKLRDKGMYVPAIRPPTVSTSRLRLTIMSEHGEEHLEKFIRVMKNFSKD